MPPPINAQRDNALDAAIEYYLPGQGILSAGLFYKRIDDPIYTQTTAETDYQVVGQTIAQATVTRPMNATRSTIKGLELNAQSQFTFLPGFLSGFGIGANVTFIDGKAEGVFNRADKLPLFLQSKVVGTAQLFYERKSLSARVAYSYRSKYLAEVGPNASQDIYVDNFGQLDAQLSYRWTDNVTTFVEGANLTDAPLRRFTGISRQLNENQKYGPTFRGGVRVRF